MYFLNNLNKIFDNLILPIIFYSANTEQTNSNQQNNYASSEDEQHKYQRFDSTASYTSEDEPNNTQNYASQQSENESISYYNPESFEEEQQQSYYGAEAIKRTYSYTSDEADDGVSNKRQKLRYFKFWSIK